MKKLLFALSFVLIFNVSVLFAAETDYATIWDKNDYSSDDKFPQNKENFFEQEKHKYSDKEIEKLLNVKLVPVSLEDCIKTAVENNYNIRAKKSLVKETVWNKRNAYTQFLPDVEYDFSIQKLSGTYLIGGIVPADIDEIPIQSIFTIGWDVFDKGKSFFNLSEKRKLYKASVLQQNFTRDEVILNTAISYYELLKNKAEIDIYAVNVIDRQAQYDMTKARYEAGVGTKFDIYRAEAELAKAKQQYITSFNTIRINQARLANYTGIDVSVPLYPKEIEITERKLSEIDIETLIKYAKSSRKDVLAERKRIDAMKTVRNSQYTDFIPDVRIDYLNAHNGTARAGLFPSNSFTLTVSIPLAKKLGLDTVTRAQAQTAAIKAAQLSLEQKIRDIELSVISSKQNSASAFERIAASRKEVFAAEKSLENAIVLMNVGLATFIDVIQAQGLKVNAQVGLAENITDYNIAQVQILFDAGMISVDNVLNGLQQNFTP
ncbi:MAG: TolC family protein [Candidatus Gastranaerophilales bacterium]|nr:TolC family protein [Candidatus Gastranaerophilales bacterium]